MVSWLFGLAACDPNLAIGPADKSDGTDTADTSFDSAADTSVDDSGDTAGGVETGDSADPIVDADGDGFLASEGDCDDTRANVYPGAQDLCDSLDQDCDGEAVPSGSCSEIVQAEDAASRTIVGEGGGSFGYPISAGEVDGDGNADVWLLNNDESGGYSLLSGIELLQRGDEAEREFYTLIDEYPAYQFAGAVGAGDYNDDGYDDFWLNAQEYAPIGSTGGAFLFLGGATRWVSGERSAMDDADGYWEDDRDDYRLGGVLAGGDLTADGLADALFLGEFNDDGTLWWTLVPGTTEAPPFGASATDFPVWIDTHGEEYGVSYSTAVFMGDLDGDGSDELLVNHANTVGNGRGMMIIEGEEIATADGAWAADLVSGFHYDDGTGDTLGMGYGFRTGEIAGDADGDGLPNVLFILSRESTTGLDSTACALVLGPGIPDGNLAGSELAQICTLDDPADGSEAASYPIAWTNDIDGDGGAELMVSRDTGAWSYEYNTCVVRSSIVALGGVIDALDPAFVPGPCYVYDGSIDRPLWIDMTGDGLSDMIYGQNDYDDPTYGDRAGRIVVVDGFEIPWNDPSKW